MPGDTEESAGAPAPQPLQLWVQNLLATLLAVQIKAQDLTKSVRGVHRTS